MRPYDVEYVTSNVLKVLVDCGSYAEQVTFYDLSRSLVSEQYQNPCFFDDEIVSYITHENELTLVWVKKIFDDTILLKEELDMGGIYTVGEYYVDIKNDVVTVKHCKGEDYHQVTEKFVLDMSGVEQ